MRATLGFIGLGGMGAPMAARLLAAGYTLNVHARRPEAATALVAGGAVFCHSPRQVAHQSEVVFTMVTDTQAVESVTCAGDESVVAGAHPGLVLIDHSSIAPAGARRIASALQQQGVDMLDAPVSGGIAGARAGTLSIMVGGDPAVFSRCQPLLLHLGTTVNHIGPIGAGQIAKICNQICLLVNQLGVAEAVLLAEQSGIDFDKVRPALMGGFAASKVLEIQAPKMTARRFAGEIESRLHDKDIRVALEWARALGVELPASTLAAGLLADLQKAGGARLDSAAIVTILEQQSRKA